MDDRLITRPSKRSKLSPLPLSKSQNEFNIKRNTQSNPLSKETLRNFHNSTTDHQSAKKTPSKSPSFFRKNLVLNNKSKSPVINRTPISKVTPSKLKFQIHQDEAQSDLTPSKIPISNLKPDTIHPVTETRSTEKISLKSLLEATSRDQAFKDPNPIINPDLTHNIGVIPNAQEGSLVHQAQLPFIKLNNWFKITEHKILENSTNGFNEKYLHTVTHSELFSDNLIFVKCSKLNNDGNFRDEEISVLLLNHKQNVYDAVKINEQIQSGSRLLLIEGFNSPIGMKIYKNWKLLINVQN